MFSHYASWYSDWTQWAGWSTNNSFGWISGCSQNEYNGNTNYSAVIKTDSPDIYLMKVNLTADNNNDGCRNKDDDMIEEATPLYMTTNGTPKELKISVEPTPPDGFELAVFPTDNTKLKLWKDQAKTEPITQNFVYGSLTDPPPDKIYVEALEATNTLQKIELALYPEQLATIVPISGVPSTVTANLTIAKDLIGVTIIKIDYVEWFDKDNNNATRFYKVTGD